MLKFLFELILILYIVKEVVRFALRYFFQSAVKNAMNGAQQQYQQQNYQQQQKPRNDGTVRIEHIPQHEKRKGSVPDTEGDFVDYEEIK